MRVLVFVGLLAAAANLAGCSDPGGDATAQAPAHPGETTYNRYCFSCHAAGVAGAPKVGVADQWAPRAAKGREALLATTKSGIAPGMPPMGLCRTCSDEELLDAIDYMIENSQ